MTDALFVKNLKNKLAYNQAISWLDPGLTEGIKGNKEVFFLMAFANVVE